VTSTIAVRKFRARRRSGALLVKVEIDGPSRDELVEAGLLKEWNSECPYAVAEAIAKLLRLLPMK
jgi:hypothetical protein